MTYQLGNARLGIRLPNSGPFATAENLASLATHVEDCGYDMVWLHDHISWPQSQLSHFATGSLEACTDQDPNFWESVTSAAFILGRLRRVQVGIAGLVLPLRDPRVLAKQLAAASELSEGRLVVAFGIGAIRNDFEVMGVPFTERGRHTTESLEVLRAVIGDHQPVSFSGKTVSFENGTFLPSPKRLPLWLTGSSEAGLVRAARLGDGWLTVYQSVDDFGALVHRLGELISETETPQRQVEIGYETYVCVAETTQRANEIAAASLEAKFGSLERGREVCVIGSPEEALHRLGAYAQAGADHLELKFIAHDMASLGDMTARLASAAGLSESL